METARTDVKLLERTLLLLLLLVCGATRGRAHCTRPASESSCVLCGVLVDPSGRPLAQRELALVPYATIPALVEGTVERREPVAVAITDATGAFVLVAPAGVYALRTGDAPGPPLLARVALPRHEAAPLELIASALSAPRAVRAPARAVGAESPLPPPLEPGGRVLLELHLIEELDPRSPAPVGCVRDDDPDGLRAALELIDGARHADSDGVARFRLDAPGEFLVFARAAATSPPTVRRITLAPGTNRCTLALGTSTVSGSFDECSEDACPLVLLSPRRVDDLGDFVVTTSAYSLRLGETVVWPEAGGRFVLRQVPPGDYLLRVLCPGHTLLPDLEITVREGADVDVGTLAVRALTDVRGTVLDLPQDARERALELLTTAGEHVRIVPLFQGGTFAFGDVSAGEYELRMHDAAELWAGPRVRTAAPAANLSLTFRVFVPAGAR